MKNIQNRLLELFKQDFIIDLKSSNKKDALKELTAKISEDDKISNRKKLEKGIFKREKLMSTGIGYEIAIPHVRDKTISDFVICLGRKKEGIEYESIDDKPVKLIFMIAASDSQDKEYIKLLSKLVLHLKNEKFRDKLITADSTEELFYFLQEAFKEYK